MSFMKCMIAMCALSMFAAHAQPAGPEAETVRIVASDSFGELGAGCSVRRFVPDNAKTQADLVDTDTTDQPDLSGRFDGLIGHRIPFGHYIAFVRCQKPAGAGATFFPVVRQRNTILFLAGYSCGGDDQCFAVPSLTIQAKNDDVSLENTKYRIKAAALFLDASETASFDNADGNAVFYKLVPGRYFLHLLRSDAPVCTAVIDLLRPGASVKMSVDDGCRFSSSSPAVKVVGGEATPAGPSGLRQH